MAGNKQVQTEIYYTLLAHDKDRLNKEFQEVNKTIYTEGNYIGARYIVFIPHSPEIDALIAARKAALGPIIHLGNDGQRMLRIRTNKGVFEIDPNNVFHINGVEFCCSRYIKSWRRLNGDTQIQIINAVNKFVDAVSRRIFRHEMILALHQNTENHFGIISYKNMRPFSRMAEKVNISTADDSDNFALTNSAGWFELLKRENWNVVLQKNEQDLDNGSLSFAATSNNLSYVNIEVQLGNHDKQEQMIRTVNRLLERYPRLAIDMNFMPSGI